ncbi:origin recognition complex subunit 6-domain-containing protein [Tricladium varicosporioides]|nr:origin recognition complex subunit 6-domain-containing protein [Hymenoscyphus varicosporioides]
MSRPVEQALTNLIPRHPGPLPPELLELAKSLLAQSRTKASTLKAEEEIGRTYACANIACERLKTKLDLPPIEPRPPISPRAYKALYTHLNSLLMKSSPRKSRNPTPLNRITAKSFNPSSPKPSPSLVQKQKPTPNKETSLDSFRKNRTEKSGLRYGGDKERDERVPKWIPPVVRKLCMEMNTKKAIPHVLAGVESVLTLPTPDATIPSLFSEDDRKISGLIGAIWFFVIQEISGKDITGSVFKQRRAKILTCLQSVENDQVILEKIGDDEEAWKGWDIPEELHVQNWVVEVSQRGWLDLDWYYNINPNAVAEGKGDPEAMVIGEGPKNNVGRRMEDEYDFTSPEKKAQYKQLRAEMLEIIDKLIEEGIMDDELDAMDTAEG